MAQCNIQRIRTRAIAILLANRLSSYSDLVGGNSRYPVTQEFTDTILEVDAMVVNARLSNPGDPYRPGFMIAPSVNLAHGDLIPSHIGAHGDVDVSIGGVFEPARYAKSRAEVIALREHPALYPNTKRWAFIEDNRVFHNGDAARVWYPSFTKGSVCQAPEQDELAEICGTVAMMPKDGAVTPELYGQLGQYFAAYLAMLRGEKATLPPIEEVERQLAA